MQAINTITMLPATKDERQKWSRQAKEQILSGNYDPGTIYINCKSAMDVLKQIIDDKQVKDAVMEGTLRGETTLEMTGGTLSITQKSEYHFSHDPTWFELETEILRLKNKQKEHEGIMKATKEIVTLPSGVQVHPARRIPQGEILNCKLK